MAPTRIQHPTTLHHLPPELLLFIAEALASSHDLLALTLASQHLHRVLTPALHAFAVQNRTLAWAARRGHEPLVRILLDRGVHADTRLTPYGKTALHYAACGARGLSTLQLLLDRGADINLRGASGQTALHSAALGAHVDAVRVLLARGADVTVRDAAGLTALLLAIRYASDGCAESVFRLLVEHGAAVDVQERYGGWTALHWAVAKGWEDTVRLLLEKGASIRAVTRGAAKETPVHWALRRGDEGMVVLLLEKGLRERQKKGLAVEGGQVQKGAGELGYLEHGAGAVG